MCKLCDIVNEGIEQVPPSPFDENDINRVTNGVWIGEFTVDNLPLPVYLKTSEYLKGAVSLGFAEYEKVDEILKADLMENIYLFSGAKTYQQVRTLTSLLTDQELKTNFYKFKEAATPILHDYNVAYLQTEYYTAKGSSRMAAFWDRIGQEADVLPLLKYQTVGDARVRPTHQALDEIIRPVNDSFWKNYFPPNGWRCRCTVEQLADGDVTDLGGFVPPDDVPPEFMMNSGMDGYIFKEKGKGKHPYFDVSKGDKELAKRNFGLPIPQAPKSAPVVFRNVPSNIDDFSKTIDKRIFNLLEKETPLIKSSKENSFYEPTTNTVNISQGSRSIKSTYYTPKTIYHEYAHAIHYQKNICKLGIGANEDYLNEFNNLKKKIVNPKEIENKLNTLLSKIHLKKDTEELLKMYGADNLGDLSEMVGSTADSLMSLTNSRYGFGHTLKYMKVKGAKEAEMFAHTFENYFIGNPVFKEVMPEIYDQTIKYVEKLLK